MSEAFDVRAYVESSLTRVKDSAGDELTAECPSCDKWGSFYVNSISGKYVCFSCDWRGRNIVGLVAHVEGLTYTEAAKYVFTKSVKLRRRGDILTLRERIALLRGKEVDEDNSVAYELPLGFRPVYDSKTGKWSLPAYLRERRIKSNTAKRWRLGWCKHGRYAHRLVIPIVCPGGYSFTARDMDGDQEPKYLNPPGADHRRLLIGWDVVDLKGDFCIVEGPLDVIKLDQHGISALAVGGKELHAEQLSMLFKLSENAGVTVMLDPEEKKAPYSMANQLAVHFNQIHIARLPDGVDPGKSKRSQARAAVAKAERFTGSRLEGLKGKMEAAKGAVAARYG